MASLVSLSDRSSMRVSTSMARARLRLLYTDRPPEKALAPLATLAGDRARRRPCDAREPRDPRDRREPVDLLLTTEGTEVGRDLPRRRRRRCADGELAPAPALRSARPNPGVTACSPRMSLVSSRVRCAVAGGDKPLPPRVRRCRLDRVARRSLTESRMLSAAASCAATSGVRMPVRATVLRRQGVAAWQRRAEAAVSRALAIGSIGSPPPACAAPRTPLTSLALGWCP